jgi:hypothetical protein
MHDADIMSNMPPTAARRKFYDHMQAGAEVSKSTPFPKPWMRKIKDDHCLEI